MARLFELTQSMPRCETALWRAPRTVQQTSQAVSACSQLVGYRGLTPCLGGRVADLPVGSSLGSVLTPLTESVIWVSSSVAEADDEASESRVALEEVELDCWEVKEADPLIWPWLAGPTRDAGSSPGLEGWTGPVPGGDFCPVGIGRPPDAGLG